MIVVSVAKCPPSLRGDLTKWFFEISTNVFVGIVSARVRDNLWDRIVKSSKTGRAVMVFTTNTEQGFDFRVHNGERTAVDLDGLKIMRRPPPSKKQKSLHGYSKASVYRKAKMNKTIKANNVEIKTFADIRIHITNGIRKIISIEALDVENNTVLDENIWPFSDEECSDYDKNLCLTSLTDFLNHISNKKLILADSGYSLPVIEELCINSGVEMNIVCFESIRSLSKKKLYDLRKYDLDTLKQYYNISDEHGTYSKCNIMVKIYNELIGQK